MSFKRKRGIREKIGRKEELKTSAGRKKGAEENFR